MGDTQQFDDLARLYGSFGEEELQSLGQTYNDLTEVAQKALKAEFDRRGLTLPAPSTAENDALQNDSASSLEGFAANASEDCTFEFTDVEDAYLAQSVLRSAGIESVVPTSEIGAIDTPRLIVAPADARSAELILSRPNATGLGDEDGAGYVEPICPQCGAPDPLLESVEPTNQWRCEACNHLWQDAAIA